MAPESTSPHAAHTAVFFELNVISSSHVVEPKDMSESRAPPRSALTTTPLQEVSTAASRRAMTTERGENATGIRRRAQFAAMFRIICSCERLLRVNAPVFPQRRHGMHE
jgi:hypothetical protein